MQGKRLLLGAIGGFCVLSSSATALAGECWGNLGPGGCVSVPWGWYVEGNLGLTRISGTSFGATVNGSGLNIDLGYKFMPYFGIELGFSKYPDVGIKNHFGEKVATASDKVVDIAARGILPLGSFEAFSKVGIGFIRSHIMLNNSGFVSPVSSGNQNVTGAYVAVGAQYYISPNIAAQVQWARAGGNGKTGTLDLWTVGATYLYG